MILFVKGVKTPTHKKTEVYLLRERYRPYGLTTSGKIYVEHIVETLF